MLNFGSSDEAIKGLAKIIAKEPTFPQKLRHYQNIAIEEGAMNNSPEYINQQEEILKKAEEMGLAQTGYIFHISGEIFEEADNYMIYKNIMNEMVPLLDGFKFNPRKTIKGIEEIIECSKNNNLKNLVTFEVGDESKFCSHPWDNFDEVDRGEEKEDKHGHHAFHLNSNLSNYQAKKLQENGIEYHEMDDNEAYNFVQKLGIVQDD